MNMKENNISDLMNKNEMNSILIRYSSKKRNKQFNGNKKNYTDFEREKENNLISDVVDNLLETKEWKPKVKYNEKSSAMFEGYAYKFCKGIKENLIKKYCKISNNIFMYYKDQYTSEYWLAKPIASINLEGVKAINAVKFPNNPCIKKSEAYKKIYYFEIIMEKSEKSLKTNEYHNSYNIISDSKSSKIEDKKLFSLSKFESPQNGHLMRSLRSTYEIIKEDIQLEEKEYKIEKNKKVKVINVKGIKFYNIDEAKDFINYAKTFINYFSKKNKISEPKQYLIKNQKFKKETWTYREFDWYLSENRLLFGVENRDEFLKWICILNWLVDRTKEPKFK